MSFPPESESPQPERLAPVAFLHDARRAAQARSPETPIDREEKMRDHPSKQHPAVSLHERTVDDDAPVTAADTARQRASNVSLQQLARRGLSRWELEQVLEKRAIDPCAAQAEVSHLEGLGLLNDEALAADLVHSLHVRKGLGRSAIEQELKRRHIEPAIIEESIEEIADDDELQRATELAVKRLRQLASYDDVTAKRRLHGFLARKGYDSATLRRAMEAAFATRGQRGVRFQ